MASGPNMVTDLLAKLDFTLEARPPVGVSACLVGDAVRYDGDDKFQSAVAELEPWLELRRYCPEVGIGLPVPRPAIEVRNINGEERVRGVEDPERDFTHALHDYAREVTAVDGYIFKARSPSCGWDTTPVFDETGAQAGTTSGLFNQGVQARFPGMPFCDEEMLQSEAGRADFVLRVYCHQALRRNPGVADELRHQSKSLAPRYQQAVEEQIEAIAAPR